jgi:putative sterol carrier protein
MATIEECRTALERLGEYFAKRPNPPAIERSLSCNISDLDDGFHAQLRNGEIVEVEQGRNPDAQITLTSASDDLVALSRGELSFGSAWASGKVKLDASFMDMLKLRSLL